MAEVVLPTGIIDILGGMDSFVVATPFIIILVILGLFMGLLLWKTPVLTFLKAFIKGGSIIAMKRKDGVLEFVPGVYKGGLIESKYGTQILDDGSSSPEKKSGARIAFGIDTIGITLTPGIMRLMKAIKKEGYSDYRSVEDAIYRWRKCKKKGCDFEGPAEVKYTKVKTKIGEIEKEETKFEGLQCPKCGSKELKKTYQKLAPPLHDPYEVLSVADYERYFKYNYTPSRNSIIIEREVKSQMAKQRQFPIKWVAAAMAFFIILLAVVIALNILSTQGLITNPENLVTLCSKLKTTAGAAIPG